MKTRFLVLSLLLVSLFALNANIAERATINEAWTFVRGDWPEGKQESVTLPHTYNVEDCYTGGRYYRGEAFYTRMLEANELNSQKRTFIRFESACLVAKTWINGEFLGEHRGGYSAFTYELTDFLKYDGSDIIKIETNNKKQSDVMPRSGDFNLYGGLTRDVQLFSLPEVAISPLHYSSDGIYLHPNRVTNDLVEGEGVVRLSVKALEGDITKEGRVLLEIADTAGEKVVEVEKAVNFTTGESEVSGLHFTIENPILWDGVANPYLYTVKASILDLEGNLIDSWEERTGFRYVSADAKKGFFLNGKSIRLNGVNRHQDFDGFGAAIKEEHHDLDMEIMKDMGVNAIRLAHYQQDKYMYELCDKEGMIIWAEIPFVSFGLEKAIGAKRKSFLENGKEQLSELIYQNFNNPSIAMWGIYNELKNYDIPTGMVKELNALSKKLDPNRATVAAANFSGPFNNVTDWLGWNKYSGWYAGAPSGFTSWTDSYHKRNPNRPISISEYGAGGSIEQDSLELRKSLPGAKWHPENWQCEFHEVYWKTIKGREFIWGSFVWNMFDFTAFQRTEGDTNGRNDKGLVTYDRKTKKDVFFLYQAQWHTPEEKPVVYITQRRFNKRNEAGTFVKGYTNAEEVELFLNGESRGMRMPNDIGVVRWENETLIPGENEVVLKGYLAGKEIKSDSVIWTLE